MIIETKVQTTFHQGDSVPIKCITWNIVVIVTSRRTSRKERTMFENTWGLIGSNPMHWNFLQKWSISLHQLHPPAHPRRSLAALHCLTGHVLLSRVIVACDRLRLCWTIFYGLFGWPKIRWNQYKIWVAKIPIVNRMSLYHLTVVFSTKYSCQQKQFTCWAKILLSASDSTLFKTTMKSIIHDLGIESGERDGWAHRLTTSQTNRHDNNRNIVIKTKKASFGPLKKKTTASGPLT